MRILVHDFSGHPFQAQLSRGLARRGHQVTHSSCDAYVSGKGDLRAHDGETITFETIGCGVTVEKMRFARRLLHELRFGVELVRHVRRVRPDVTILSNFPLPGLVIAAAWFTLTRRRWVLWHQDLYAQAVRSFAGTRLSRGFRLVATAFELAERWCARRADAIVVIAESFVPTHRAWGTAGKVTVVPNWAPLDEIVPVERRNAWSDEHDLSDTLTLLYSGTLGLKHRPELLVQLAARVRERGRDVRLVVVNEGPARGVLESEAARSDVPVTLLPYQPYERLPEVLGSGDVLVVLLEPQAGAFSVPSKTLSYLCAGRPVLGLVPRENLAAELIERAEGLVVAPDTDHLDAAAAWVDKILGDPDRAAQIGRSARDLAEQEFDLERCTDRFEAICALIAPGAPAEATDRSR